MGAMSKDERTRIRDAERDYHASMDTLDFDADPEVRELFLDRANHAAFDFRVVLGLRRLRRERKANA